jgi:dipeptidyl aminopeptidase/acylaminoacyl peptidase
LSGSADGGSIKTTGTIIELTGEGVRLPVMLYRPPGVGASAAVILCPGGIQRGMFEIMEWIASRLCAAGILALTMSWRDASPLYDTDDIRLAVDWLLLQPGVNPSRIGILGMSRGANAALRAAAIEPRLRAAATFGAVTDLLQQVHGSAAYAPGRHKMLVNWLGDPVANREFYEKSQAISCAADIKQPLLMVHGAHDMHSPPEQSIWMKEAIESGGNHAVRLEIIPGMGHYGDVIPNSYGFDRLGNLFVPFFLEQLS